MMEEWDSKYPGRVEHVFSAMQNIAPSQMADRRLFDFVGLDGDAPMDHWLKADRDPAGDDDAP